jgi:adenylate cyclase
MAKEIERKFLVDLNKLNDYINKRVADTGELYLHYNFIRQGYILDKNGLVIRIRLVNVSDAILTFKDSKSLIERDEYEMSIDFLSGFKLFGEANNIVVKDRAIVEYKSKKWEIDIFHNDNHGLVIAEIELDNKDEVFDIPPFCTKEVTYDTRYLNSNLGKSPYKNWATEL